MKIKKINKQYTEIQLDDLKKQLNIDLDYNNEDSYLESLIEAAIDFCENLAGFDIVSTDNELLVKDFNSNSINIYEQNFSGITSITLNSEEITSYTIEEYYTKFKIEFTDSMIGDLKINFKTGDLKARYKQAILIKASDLYDVRQSYTSLNHNENIIKYLLM
ncbi:MAG: head-tail connector protein [bacterium]